MSQRELKTLKECRSSQNMTAKDVANTIGVSESTIYRYESQHMEPTISRVYQLKRLFPQLDTSTLMRRII